MSLTGFQSADTWAQAADIPDSVLIMETARTGDPTLKRDGIYLHSRYNPREEAQRLVASAKRSTPST